MNELADYYQNLYKNHDSDENEESMQEFFGNKIIPTLSEHSKIIQYKGMILCKECFEALKRFPNCKAPGNDDANSKNLSQLPFNSLILWYVISVKFVKIVFYVD